MSSTTIAIMKFDSTNYVQWATEMTLLLAQKQVYGIITGYDNKQEEPAANLTASEKATFQDCMNHHGVARLTILLGMEPRIQAEYTVVEDAKTLCGKLASAYKSKLKLNIFEIWEDLWSIKLQNLRSCFHCQRQGLITENCASKKRGNPPKAANTAAKALTGTTSTITTSIKNYWKMASSNASCSDWFIDCGCTTHISSCQSMFITYTEYPPNMKKVKGNNGVRSFAFGYGSLRLICQLPDGKTETIILQEVMHLPGSFNLISQSQIMDQDVKVEPVNYYGLNIHNHHGKLIATAPQVEGLFILDWATDSTEYTAIDDSYLLALTTTAHASWHNAEKRMLWHRRFALVVLNALELLPMVTDALKVTRKCDGESCIKCKMTSKLFTLDTTSHATEPLQLVHSDICGPLEKAIGGGQYMLLFIHDATRHTDEYILKYKLKALAKFKEWKALGEKESGKQVKRFRTDGGGEYTSKKLTEYLKSEATLKKTTTHYTPQSNGVAERVNRKIMESVRRMMNDGLLSKKYWVFAVSVAVYLKNRTLAWSLFGKPPYAAWQGSGKKPSLKYFRVLGCLAFVHVAKEKRKKLDYRATSGIFIRYSILPK